MHSATLTSSPPPIAISSSSNFTTPSKCTPQIRLNPRKRYPIKLLPISLKCTQSPFPKSYDYDYSPTIISPIQTSSKNVTQKLQYLVTEFKSLTQPIDRVKRLLDYATRLPYFDESARSQENRVKGCTAQLWLEVTMDLEGSMRFKVDSDSEITKGFCSCLIWLLDGAAPEEVVGVKAEDLAEMNVGILPANSRVNTWNTVLISMQKRTKALVAERFTQLPPPPPLEPFPFLVASTLSDTAARGSFEEAKDKKIGKVVRFYTNSEVKIVLAAGCGLTSIIRLIHKSGQIQHLKWQDIHGCQLITSLVVYPLPEHVHAILDQAGFGKVAAHLLIPNTQEKAMVTGDWSCPPRSVASLS